MKLPHGSIMGKYLHCANNSANSRTPTEATLAYDCRRVWIDISPKEYGSDSASNIKEYFATTEFWQESIENKLQIVPATRMGH